MQCHWDITKRYNNVNATQQNANTAPYYYLSYKGAPRIKVCGNGLQRGDKPPLSKPDFCQKSKLRILGLPRPLLQTVREEG